MSVKRFNPDDGSEADPQIVGISINQLEAMKADLQKQINDIDAMIADLNTLE